MFTAIFRLPQPTFLAVVALLLLFSSHVQALPLKVRQQLPLPGEKTVFTTVKRIETPTGVLLQTCEVTLTPVKDFSGADAFEKITSCSVKVETPTDGGSSTTFTTSGATTETSPSVSTSTTAAGSASTTSVSATETPAPTSSSTDPNASAPPQSSPSAEPSPALSTIILTPSSSSEAASSTEVISSSASPSSTIVLEPSSTIVLEPSSSVVESVSSSSVEVPSSSAPEPTPTPTATLTDSFEPTPSTTLVVTPDGPEGDRDAAAPTTPVGGTAADASAAPEATEPAAFELPGKKLSVLPIGLGVFAGISVIALIVVGLVTYERTKYRRQFRKQKLAEAGAPMGYGGYNNV